MQPEQRRNWCEAGAGVALGPCALGGFARRGDECTGPGLCMKQLDPYEQGQRQRQRRWSAVRGGQLRGPRPGA